MTTTALVALVMALTAEKIAPVGGAPADAPSAPGRRPPALRAEVTCALRVVHAPEGIDAGILARGPRHSVDDAMVRDTISPCLGAVTRRVGRAEGAEGK